MGFAGFTPRKGSTLPVTRPFSEYGAENGYLVLRVGQHVSVDHVGQEGDELGWLFGCELGTKTRGWFPIAAVEPPPFPQPRAACGQVRASTPPPPPDEGGPDCKAAAAPTRQAPARPQVRASTPPPPPDEGGPDCKAAAAPTRQAPARPQVRASTPPPPPDEGGPDCKAAAAPTRQAPARPQDLGAIVDICDPGLEISGILVGTPGVVMSRNADGTLAVRIATGQIVDVHHSALRLRLQGEDGDQPVSPSRWLSPPAPKGQALTSVPPPGLDRAPKPEDLEAVEQGLNVGSNLPMHEKCGDLQRLIAENRVVVIDAATGSGKSTLVPLCLAHQCLQAGRDCRVVVTQPRRIAAKGLAARVSQQVGRPVGELVGYRVGSDKQDKGALVVYVTVGHFLEALVHNPGYLETFSHVVLDEVHERFVEADFLMALLRLSLSRPGTLRQRVVVMSATLQKALGKFFRPVLLPSPGKAELASITLPGSTPFEVTDFFWEAEDLPHVMCSLNFSEALPCHLKQKTPRAQSDLLSTLCKKLAPAAANLICWLYDRQVQVVLVFLPGLDQMVELEKKLKDRVLQRRKLNPDMPEPDVILMHSSLEEETYRRALDPVTPDQWKVVLATNIAESSLTVPGVGAVLDSALHRVSVYDDEAKMSCLMTTWCCHASLKQRRGRTGRTNPGSYYCMVPKRLYAELAAYDQSGVERSPLTRVALEAAHLAEILSAPPLIRAELPVVLKGVEGQHMVDYFDGDAGLWRTRPSGRGPPAWTAEEDLSLADLHMVDVLNLLPSPPRIERVSTAMIDLQELGALTEWERPTALGIACLKLPTEVSLARLVILGYGLRCSAAAAVLAAALSLTPSCDVFRTPFSTREWLEPSDVTLLRDTISARRQADGQWRSEPLTIYNMCKEWLKKGGGLGKVQRTMSCHWSIHERLWTQFTNKVVDLWRAMLRLLPQNSAQRRHLEDLLELARGKFWNQQDKIDSAMEHMKVRPQKLLALLTWGLAPGGFLAVGQSPRLYGKGSYEDYWRAVQTGQLDPRATLSWPQDPAEVKQAELFLQKLGVKPLQILAVPNGSCVTCTSERDELQDAEGLVLDAELLYRLCCPFNGKASIDNLKIKQPNHPCALNWYMPFRSGRGLKEVCLNWKAQAASLMQIQGCPPSTRSRPKRFAVACGGDYRHDHHTERRVTMLRGVSVLPDEQGGRTALLWLLAGGVPREAAMTALVAPTESLEPHEFEVRGLWMWERTFRLPDHAVISSADLRAVNDFRQTYCELTQSRPHRLAGLWWDRKRHLFQIECLDDPSGGLSELLSIQDSRDAGNPTRLRQQGRSSLWVPLEGEGVCEETPEGLLWRGELLSREPTVPAAVEQLRLSAVQDWSRAADMLMQVAEAPPLRRGPWPGRIVPLVAETAMSPIDLDAVETLMANFRDQLRKMPEQSGFTSQDEDSDSDEDEENDGYRDRELEKINQDWMWRLAEMENFSALDVHNLVLRENSLALPTAAVCVGCGEEGKPFSKRQLGQPAHLRMCQECVLTLVAMQQGKVYKPPEKTIIRSSAAPARPPALIPVAKVCCVCNQQIDKENSTITQLAKPCGKRKCKACLAKTATAEGSAS
ncbi:unnamed protein product [Effrenium voratum]|nr:unnamed protein product [Effrenium voratum]